MCLLEGCTYFALSLSISLFVWPHTIHRISIKRRNNLWKIWCLTTIHVSSKNFLFRANGCTKCKTTTTTTKTYFRFSNCMFCSLGNNRRTGSITARFNGAVNYETGPAGSRYWKCPQCGFFPIQHSNIQTKAYTCKLVSLLFF